MSQCFSDFFEGSHSPKKQELYSSMELISDYFANSKAQIVRDIVEDQHLFKRFYHMRWFQKTREVHHSSNDIFGNPAKLLVHLITSVSKLLKEYCDYVN